MSASQPGTSLAVDPDEAQAVSAAAAGYAAALPMERAASYRALAETASSGQVPGKLVCVLAQVATASLQTRQARKTGRVAAERLIIGVYPRTPAGKAAATQVEVVNRALKALLGRELESVRVTSPSGKHTPKPRGAWTDHGDAHRRPGRDHYQQRASRVSCREAIQPWHRSALAPSEATVEGIHAGRRPAGH
jgi:hypothetical protein